MTKYAGIVGFPVSHSLSPVFQSAAFAASGLDIRYERWETRPAELAARVEMLRAPGCIGANVTIPFKEAVIPFLDELGDQSARVGAVNTVVNRDGRLFGFNTDGPGFVAALRNEQAFHAAGKRFLLLGAGGAARGIAFALADARAAEVSVTNRNLERAERLAGDVAATFSSCETNAVAAPISLAGFDCIVNCTSVGMRGGGAERGLPCDLDGARPRTLVVDIVYAPTVTPFLAGATAAGFPVLGGLPMLIYQGALAFELWTGVPAPVEAMFEAARRELDERQHLDMRKQDGP